MDIAKIWDVFLKRKVFLTDRLVLQLGTNEVVICTDIHNLVASLIFIDLISVLDYAMEEKLRKHKIARGRDVNGRIEALRKKKKLIDPDALHQLRKRRNELAHAMQKLTTRELNAGIATVEKQLQAWDFIGTRPNYIPFTDQSQWRKRNVESDLPYERDFSIGVQIAETGEPVLSYDYEQRVDNPEKISLGVIIERKGKGH